MPASFGFGVSFRTIASGFSGKTRTLQRDIGDIANSRVAFYDQDCFGHGVSAFSKSSHNPTPTDVGGRGNWVQPPRIAHLAVRQPATL